MNLASRITALARAGSVLATREVRDAAARGLPLVVGGRALAQGRRRAGARSTARGAWPDEDAGS